MVTILAAFVSFKWRSINEADVFLIEENPKHSICGWQCGRSVNWLPGPFVTSQMARSLNCMLLEDADEKQGKSKKGDVVLD